MIEDKTIFEAMQAFDSLTGAVAFTPNEIALFYVILSSWNVARRPTVLQQWANMTCARCGLKEKNSLPNARNGLVQKGVLFFKKEGNRGVPQYSLNPLFGLPEPDWLLPKYGSKHGSKHGSNSGSNHGGKPGVNMEVNPDSLEDKDKGKDSISVPSTEEATAYALSCGQMIAPDCVAAWHDNRIAVGWVTKSNQPILDWKADLRGFARHWLMNEQQRKQNNGKRTGPNLGNNRTGGDDFAESAGEGINVAQL